FKLFEYATGRDDSPRAVKVEEMANAALLWVGLVGLHGLAYGHALGTPLFWRAWVVLAVVVSLVGLVWSPKLRYGEGVLGTKRLRALMAVSIVLFTPMLVGVWRYAGTLA
ncbi:MAG: hypothetical protein ACREO3_01175, partial [Arenimonas sp.]